MKFKQGQITQTQSIPVVGWYLRWIPWVISGFACVGYLSGVLTTPHLTLVSLLLLAYLLERCYYENDQTSSKRGRPNDVSLARNGRIIDHMEETTPDTKFGPRKLNWTDTFHW